MPRKPLEIVRAVLLIGIFFFLPGLAAAHHSFAAFDVTRLVTLDGTVKQFDWVNPHVVIWVYAAPPAGGALELWAVELTSPGNLTRMGWSRLALKPGDKVSVDIHPLRDGQHGGQFKQVIVSGTGKVYSTKAG
jgi:Family of unknown function (DUF6152)